MTKITLTDLANLQNETTSVNAINANSATLTTAFDNTLSRDGTAPNQMRANLDMNSNRIINLPAAIYDTEPVRLTEYRDAIFDATTVVLSFGLQNSLQFETRATVQATQVPLTINTIMVNRYGAGFPLSEATYIRGGTVNPVTDALGNSWGLSLVSHVDPFWFGAKGDGLNADYTPIAAANVAAQAAAVPLVFKPGHYLFNTTLAFGAAGYHVQAIGKVILEHTGTGVAVTLDAGAVANLFDGSFGRGNPFIITGNTNTTILLYVRGYHHAFVEAILGNGNSTTGIGLQNEYSVLSDFKIIATNNSIFPTVTKVKNPAVLAQRGVGEACTASTYHFVLESQLQPLVLGAADNCRFTGTSENCAAGGVYVGPGCNNNTFYDFFCEANGGVDFYLDTARGNQFINCTGVSTATDSVFVTGSHVSTFIGGQFDKVQIILNSLHCLFDGCLVGTSFTNGDSTTRRHSCYNNALVFYSDIN